MSSEVSCFPVIFRQVQARIMGASASSSQGGSGGPGAGDNAGGGGGSGGRMEAGMFHLPTTTMVQPSEIYLLLIDVIIEAVHLSHGGGGTATAHAQHHHLPPYSPSARKGAKGTSAATGRKSSGSGAPRTSVFAAETEAAGLGPSCTSSPSPPRHHPHWRELSWILSRKRSRIDPMELLGHLPDDVSAVDLDLDPWAV